LKKIFLIFLTLIYFNSCQQQEQPLNKSQEKNDSIVILWTTKDAEVFNKMIYPYAYNSITQNWWTEVELIIWGSSTKLVKENSDLQRKVKVLKNNGIYVTACLWCAEEYSAVQILEKIGVDVKYMGKPLTTYLKSGKTVITF
jgi:hypothetical protein